MTIAVIALVAVVMGLSTIAPGLQQAFAHDVTERQGKAPTEACPPSFQTDFALGVGTHPDHNFNGIVCTKRICPGGAADCAEPIRIDIDDSFIPRH